jgi:hypothetical protein
VPVASSSPREVVAIFALSIPLPRKNPPTASARELPSTKLYSVSPRGSACPTTLSMRPLSGPLVKHRATFSSVLVSWFWMLAESKAKCALGASMPHAFKIASSIEMALAVGEFGGGGIGASSVFFTPGVVVTVAVCGGGLGSEPHPIARPRRRAAPSNGVGLIWISSRWCEVVGTTTL